MPGRLQEHLALRHLVELGERPHLVDPHQQHALALGLERAPVGGEVEHVQVALGLHRGRHGVVRPLDLLGLQELGRLEGARPLVGGGDGERRQCDGDEGHEGTDGCEAHRVLL